MRTATLPIRLNLEPFCAAIESTTLAFARLGMVLRRERDPEAWEAQRRLEASARRRQLEANGTRTQIVTGYDGVSRVRALR